MDITISICVSGITLDAQISKGWECNNSGLGTITRLSSMESQPKKVVVVVVNVVVVVFVVVVVLVNVNHRKPLNFCQN